MCGSILQSQEGVLYNVLDGLQCKFWTSLADEAKGVDNTF